MRFHHLLILVLIGVVLTFAPLAFAYDLPETVLIDQQYNARFVQRQRQRQIDENIAKHASSSEHSSMSARAVQTETSGTPVEDGAGNVTVSARTARILKRLDEQGNRDDVLSPTLHRGTPLSPTGIGSAVASVLAMVAIGWTLIWARRMEKE